MRIGRRTAIVKEAQRECIVALSVGGGLKLHFWGRGAVIYGGAEELWLVISRGAVQWFIEG